MPINSIPTEDTEGPEGSVLPEDTLLPAGARPQRELQKHSDWYTHYVTTERETSPINPTQLVNEIRQLTDAQDTFYKKFSELLLEVHDAQFGIVSKAVGIYWIRDATESKELDQRPPRHMPSLQANEALLRCLTRFRAVQDAIIKKHTPYHEDNPIPALLNQMRTEFADLTESLLNISEKNPPPTKHHLKDIQTQEETFNAQLIRCLHTAQLTHECETPKEADELLLVYQILFSARDRHAKKTYSYDPKTELLNVETLYPISKPNTWAYLNSQRYKIMQKAAGQEAAHWLLEKEPENSSLPQCRINNYIAYCSPNNLPHDHSLEPEYPEQNLYSHIALNTTVDPFQDEQTIESSLFMMSRELSPDLTEQTIQNIRKKGAHAEEMARHMIPGFFYKIPVIKNINSRLIGGFSLFSPDTSAHLYREPRPLALNQVKFLNEICDLDGFEYETNSRELNNACTRYLQRLSQEDEPSRQQRLLQQIKLMQQQIQRMTPLQSNKDMYYVNVTLLTCINLLDAEKPTQQHIKTLMKLSNLVSGNPSPLWQKFGAMLLLVAQAASCFSTRLETVFKRASENAVRKTELAACLNDIAKTSESPEARDEEDISFVRRSHN